MRIATIGAVATALLLAGPALSAPPTPHNAEEAQQLQLEGVGV